MTRYISVNDELSINVKDAISVEKRIARDGKDVNYWIDMAYKDKNKSILVGWCRDEDTDKKQEYERQLTDFMERL